MPDKLKIACTLGKLHTFGQVKDKLPAQNNLVLISTAWDTNYRLYVNPKITYNQHSGLYTITSVYRDKECYKLDSELTTIIPVDFISVDDFGIYKWLANNMDKLAGLDRALNEEFVKPLLAARKLKAECSQALDGECLGTLLDGKLPQPIIFERVDAKDASAPATDVTADPEAPGWFSTFKLWG